MDCVFCEIVAGRAPATIVRTWADAVGLVPLNPVTDGHVLIIPKRHVIDAVQEPRITASVMAAAAEYASRPCNIITSAGAVATQTVFHLHVHIVPRSEGDGLALPWTPNAWSDGYATGRTASIIGDVHADVQLHRDMNEER